QLNSAGEFGASAFNGSRRWLEINVNGTTLAPRQELTLAPYALYALSGPAVSGPWQVNGSNTYFNTGNVVIGTTSPSAKLHLSGSMKIDNANTVEFGAGIAGKEVNAGKIGYQAFTSDALDIVGAGTSGTNRKIKFWNEAGAAFSGSVGIGTN